MTTTTIAAHDTTQRSLWKLGLRAGLISTVVNTGLYVGAYAAGVFPYLIKLDPTEPGMTVVAVAIVSIVASLAAVGVFGVVERRASSPARVFAWIAGILLVASFAAPYAVPGTIGAQALVQNLMHVVVAGAVMREVWRRRVD